MALKAIKFISRWNGYNAGEVAGFEPEISDDLVAKGIAEAYVDPKAAPAPEPTGDRGAPEGVTKSGFLGRKKG